MMNGPSTTLGVRWLVRGVLLLAMAALVAPACNTEEEPKKGLANTGGSAGDGTGAGNQGGQTNVEECNNGDSRECHVTIGEHNGVVTCYVGVEICVDNAWGPCGDGTTFDIPTPDGMQWKSFSQAQQCQNNPCDPECKTFDENPPGGGWQTDGDPFLFNWPSGDPSNIPPNVWDKTQDTPCQTGADCQMNSYCWDPQTGNCPHSVCETGVGMDLGCGDCVDMVCAQDPQCCKKQYGGATCSHSECNTGGALANGCSPCVSTVCANDPFCCNVTWDNICANEAAAWCGGGICSPVCDGQSCSHDVCTDAGPLNPGCDPCVAAVCSYDSFCCNTWWDVFCIDEASWEPACISTGGNGSPTCAHDPCVQGSALTSGCANNVSDVCTIDPYCCNTFWDAACVNEFETFSPGGCPSSWPGSWDQGCVDAVSSVCGATCQVPPPPTDKGECVNWNPGQTDPDCAGIDLSVGWTCDGTIPVCNHGNATAPAGIVVKHVPENSGYFGTPNPPGTIPGQVTCTTTAPIPPGECVGVTCGGLTEYREIIVNPPPNAIAECNSLDNWGVFVAGTCGPPTCAGATVSANLKPVNMFLAVDKSGSMGGNRWTNTRNAFVAFFQSPLTDGLNVAMEFFGYGGFGGADGCYNNAAECGNPTKCSNAYVPLGTLTAQPAPADAQELALVNAWFVPQLQPGGMTPAILAFQGCHQWAAQYSSANPNEQQVCVLITDGEPNDCGAAQGPFVTAAANGFNNYGVLSYGIGIVGANPAILNAIAAAGNGQAFFVGNGNMTQDLINALLAIQGDTVSCDLDLPGGTYDPTEAEVTYVPGVGAPVPIAQVANAGACGPGGGWYLDNPNNPTLITLCPVTCNIVKADPDGSVELYIPCPGAMDVTSYSEIYESNCPDGLTPQWGYFAYDTTCPSDSNVVFQARTANVQADLATATLYPLATAHSVPTDTQICPMAPNGTCPVDFFVTLGQPDVHDKYLELLATLNPDTGNHEGPTVNGWDITYSCVPAE